MRVEGRAWTFDEDVNTDAIYPQSAYRLAADEAARSLFGSLRPGWAQAVLAGDVIVAGANFGMGSARPAPVLLRRLGIAACVADSIATLFLRNCVNAGLPVLAAPGVRAIVAEGDRVSIDLACGAIENRTSGARIEARPLPEPLRAIIADGGLLAALERKGYIMAEPGEQAAAR